MSGRPGDGCIDPRDIHRHWCGFCGAVQMFSSTQCQTLTLMPPCPRCDNTAWRDDIDELTAPDHREGPR